MALGIGNAGSQGGAPSIAPFIFTGTSDAVQLAIKGNATQTYTNAPFCIEDENGVKYIQMGYNLNGAAKYGGIIWLGNAAPNAGNTNFNLLSTGTGMAVNSASGAVTLSVANANSLSWDGSILKYSANGSTSSPVNGVVDAYYNNGSTQGWFRSLAGRKRRAATQTVTNSTTFVADDTLSVTLIAGRKYSFRVVYYFTTVATSGVKIDLNGGTATATSLQGSALFTNMSTPAILVTGDISLSALNTAVGITVTGTKTMVEIQGGLVCNVGGTFIPEFAQNLETGAAESVIAGIDSFMWVEDMP